MDRFKEFPSVSTVGWVCSESVTVKLVHEHRVGALSARGGFLSPTRYVRAAVARNAQVLAVPVTAQGSRTDTNVSFLFPAAYCGDNREHKHITKFIPRSCQYVWQPRLISIVQVLPYSLGVRFET
jgi:hypothetical protein